MRAIYGIYPSSQANQLVRFPFNSTVRYLEADLNLSVPRSALPTLDYLGEARLVVTTVRTVVEQDEGPLRLEAAVLLPSSAGEQEQVSSFALSLHWRPIGAGDGAWRVQAMVCIRTSVCRASIPIAAAGDAAEDLEWYLKLQLGPASAVPVMTRYYPPGHADRNETITVVVLPTRRPATAPAKCSARACVNALLSCWLEIRVRSRAPC